MNNSFQKELTNKVPANSNSLELAQLETLQQEPLIQSSSSDTKRRISTEEFQEIVGKAYLLQEFDQEQRTRLRTESLEVMTSLGFEQGIPVERVPEIIQSRLDIAPIYTQRILDIYFQTQEQKLQDLMSQDARPSYHAIISTYKIEIEKEMHKFFPKERYFLYHQNEGFIDYSQKLKIKLIETKERKFSLFFLKYITIKNKKDIAVITSSSCGVEIEFYDPIFLRICGDKMDKLKKEFSTYIKYHNPKYHYNIRE